jgi:hypothetical protein
MPHGVTAPGKMRHRAYRKQNHGCGQVAASVSKKHKLFVNDLQSKDVRDSIGNLKLFMRHSLLERAQHATKRRSPQMTSVLSPAPTEAAHNQAQGLGSLGASTQPKHDTKEYLADMLRELSAMAAWANLDSARAHIDAALREIEKPGDRG